MISDFLKLSLNNLRRRRLRSLLTMLGIFIGIAAVVSLISLGQGLETAVLGQFKTLSTDKLMVQSASSTFGPPGSSAVRKLNEHDLDLVRSVPGVDFAIPRLLRSTKMEFNDIVQFAKNGREGKVVSFLLGDDTGTVRVVLWDTNHIKQVEEKIINELAKR